MTPSSSVNSPRMLALFECCSSYGYLKLYGAKVKLVELSTIGSFGVYKNTIELVRSLHRNWEQHTVISQLSQFLIKIELLIGPIKNLVFLHLSTWIWAVWSSKTTQQSSKSLIIKSIPLISPGFFIHISFWSDLNIKSALFSFYFFVIEAAYAGAAVYCFGGSYFIIGVCLISGMSLFFLTAAVWGRGLEDGTNSFLTNICSSYYFGFYFLSLSDPCSLSYSDEDSSGG